MKTKIIAMLGIFTLAACGGTTSTGPRGACGIDNETCTSLSPCCSPLACKGGRCVADVCSADGATCSFSKDCCSGTCSSGRCGAPMTSCHQDGDSCSISKDCCSSPCTNGRCGQAQPVLKKIGDTCGGNAECASGQCYEIQGASGGFCTESCTRSSTCTNDGGNAGLACVHAGNDSLCAPTCAAGGACLAFGASWSCRNIISTDGTVTGVCNIWKNQALGYPCQSDGQCGSGTCSGVWCTQTCASNNDCAGPNWCIRNQANLNRCFPQCASNDDCKIYGSGAICHFNVTTISGTTHNVCGL